MIDFYKFASFSKFDKLMHAVTKKSPSKPYEFSLALHTGEYEKKILENRSYLAGVLKNDAALHFAVANQTHSDHIAVLEDSSTKGWDSLTDVVEDCDALITNKKNLILTVLTADCVPILLYDKEKQVIAAVHAGWKGTSSDIVRKTVSKMQNVFGSQPKNIVAGGGPSIGRCCYEVGEDVAKHFFDTPQGYTKKGNKYMLDLPYINKYQLLASGLREENIEMSDVCTACEVEQYFSYRKEQGCSGRFMSLIGLT